MADSKQVTRKHYVLSSVTPLASRAPMPGNCNVFLLSNTLYKGGRKGNGGWSISLWQGSVTVETSKSDASGKGHVELLAVYVTGDEAVYCSESDPSPGSGSSRVIQGLTVGAALVQRRESCCCCVAPRGVSVDLGPGSFSGSPGCVRLCGAVAGTAPRAGLVLVGIQHGFPEPDPSKP